MATIETEIARIINAKNSIRQSINSKGGNITTSMTIDTYSSAIDALSVRGGVFCITINKTKWYNDKYLQIVPYFSENNLRLSPNESDNIIDGTFTEYKTNLSMMELNIDFLGEDFKQIWLKDYIIDSFILSNDHVADGIDEYIWQMKSSNELGMEVNDIENAAKTIDIADRNLFFIARELD